MIRVKITVIHRFKPGDRVRYIDRKDKNRTNIVKEVKDFTAQDQEYIKEWYNTTKGYRVEYVGDGWDPSFILEKCEQ